ncbi:hypothetical protein [Fictibacillus barbaricus]|uniref:DUF2061 domain-containing protein n=1 Tax=Fictibacillus barbaricus TaxID=182136 RepID=A0ABS2ZC44_9BACL|nr:hypothetical protein [Fictibacillus barbaricus]MBN3544196.1 hypothetical protein [Fictibacillus barbaricus]GGB69704.1 hypothetical protein GCM10007199_39920 [Fictibacillus barbaricus]
MLTTLIKAGIIAHFGSSLIAGIVYAFTGDIYRLTANILIALGCSWLYEQKLRDI